MWVTVNEARLYFDVEGCGLVPDGPVMRAKPTLVLLHGGPGFDHTMYKPEFSCLSDIAQIIYFDQRGNGRSVHLDKTTWTLAQWADDVRELFGGFVAQAYATRYPDHPGKLILVSTAARQDLSQVVAAFRRIGGDDAAELAARYWTNPTPQLREDYLRVCHPLYRAKPSDTRDANARRIVKNEVNVHFSGLDGHYRQMDFRPALARIRCPTLVMAGERDPITPISFSEEIVDALPGRWVRFERFPDTGHGVHWDNPDRAFAVIREFIAAN